MLERTSENSGRLLRSQRGLFRSQFFFRFQRVLCLYLWDLREDSEISEGHSEISGRDLRWQRDSRYPSGSFWDLGNGSEISGRFLRFHEWLWVIREVSAILEGPSEISWRVLRSQGRVWDFRRAFRNIKAKIWGACLQISQGGFWDLEEVFEIS